MAMVITSRLLLLKKQAAYLDYLVTFQRAQPSVSGQFWTRANNCLGMYCHDPPVFCYGVYLGFRSYFYAVINDGKTCGSTQLY